MKKLIVANVFIILITGIFLFKKKYSKSEQISEAVTAMDKKEYGLKKDQSDYGHKLSRLKNEKILNEAIAKKEYDKLKYKNKLAHADAIHKLAIKPNKEKRRAPASSGKNFKVITSIKHTVVSGEDLMKISKIYYNTHNKWKLIVKGNPNENLNSLEIGQIIIIPNIEQEQVVWVNGKMVLKRDQKLNRMPASE